MKCKVCNERISIYQPYEIVNGQRVHAACDYKDVVYDDDYKVEVSQ